MKWAIVITVIGAIALAEKKVSYKGYKGLQITTPDKKTVDLVAGLADLGVKILHEPNTKRPSEVAVPPNIYHDVIKTLKASGVDYEELYKDLEAITQEQKRKSFRNSKLAKFRSYSGGDDDSIATYFPTYRQTVDFLQMLERKYPQQAHLTFIGKSHEGRDQLAIKVGTPGTNKPVIWIDGGIHAREWATVPTVLYLAQKLLANYRRGTSKDLLDTYDFYFLPIFNPDGYVHTHTVDRFWRKNRRPHSRAASCPGVDLNRNFGHKWGVSGISHKPCSESFLGDRPFSEPETRNVRDALLQFRGHLQMYMNLHAYGQMWFIPYAYSSRVNYSGLREQRRVAIAGATAIYETDNGGTRYAVGRPGDLLYDAAGGTFDWAMAEAGAKYAFAAELSPGFYEGSGLSGFDIDPDRLPRLAKEVYNGIVAAIRAM